MVMDMPAFIQVRSLAPHQSGRTDRYALDSLMQANVRICHSL